MSEGPKDNVVPPGVLEKRRREKQREQEREKESEQLPTRLLRRIHILKHILRYGLEQEGAGGTPEKQAKIRTDIEKGEALRGTFSPNGAGGFLAESSGVVDTFLFATAPWVFGMLEKWRDSWPGKAQNQLKSEQARAALGGFIARVAEMVFKYAQKFPPHAGSWSKTSVHLLEEFLEEALPLIDQGEKEYTPFLEGEEVRQFLLREARTLVNQLSELYQTHQTISKKRIVHLDKAEGVLYILLLGNIYRYLESAMAKSEASRRSASQRELKKFVAKGRELIERAWRLGLIHKTKS